MDNQTISPRQFMFLVIFFTIGSSILIVPGPVTAQAKQDSWMSIILSIVIGMGLIVLYNKIGELSAGKTFIEAFNDVFGNWVGRIFSSFYLVFVYILAALVLRNIGDFMTSQIMPETPLQFTHILFFVVVLGGTLLGIEVIGRSSEIFMPWMILLLLFLFLFSSPQISMDNFKPILGDGLPPMLSASKVMVSSPILEMVALLMIFPYVKELKQTKKGWIIGGVIGGSVLLGITSLCILVLGSDLTIMNTYPTYRIGEKISVAGFLEGLEIFIAIIWMMTIFFKLIVLYYASTVGFAQFLSLDDYRPLVLPLGMGTIILSIISYPDVAYFESFVGEIWFSYALSIGFILPLILLAGLLIKKKIKQKGA
ncbi:GerAB/ArcD/ProY family transporter [Halobacillus yeomjeoni]|uniref:Endospore germination permease n=1 Tax=Halobacillus yeomjeoni TaxID=311194 RepID=A0A931MUV8_9BACI|nr:endospore germination permease [Halobacillus yeomjeoni]MBH0230383.1 endospore germination permease [Halobacillus yeomjeoni]